MKNIIYKIKFYSDWHCGSGLSSGADTDALVIKKDYAGKVNLPYIPGRTIKGLLKDAALDLIALKKIRPDFIKTCFENNADIVSLNIGCFFGDAELSEVVVRTLTENLTYVEKLYRHLSYTKIDAIRGIAEEETLRKIEVTIPLSLYGRIIGVDLNWEYYEDLRKCIKYIKRLGTGRNRGLGRCQFFFFEEGGWK